MSAAKEIHPRIMERLEKTLALRLKKFESQRDKTRRLVEGILDRLVRLEAASGLELADCRSECDEALREVDALDVYAADATEIDRLLQRIARIGLLLNSLAGNLGAATSQTPA